MTRVDKREVMQALHRRRWTDAALLQMMKKGPKLFDYLNELIASSALPGRERANALFVLLNLTREVCPDRKPDVMRIALVELRSSEKLVRDMAVRAVLHLERMANHAGVIWGFAGREKIAAAIRLAVQAGLGAVEDNMAREWLAWEV